MGCSLGLVSRRRKTLRVWGGKTDEIRNGSLHPMTEAISVFSYKVGGGEVLWREANLKLEITSEKPVKEGWPDGRLLSDPT